MADLIAPPNPQYKMRYKFTEGFEYVQGYDSKLDAVNDMQEVLFGKFPGIWDGNKFYPVSRIQSVELVEPGDKTID